MLAIHEVNSYFRNLLSPLVNFLAARRVSAIHLKLVTALLFVLTGIIVVTWPRQHWPLLLVPLALLVRVLMNLIEDMLAAENRAASRFDNLPNDLGNLVMDCILYLPFAMVDEISVIPVLVDVGLLIINELIRIAATLLAPIRRFDGPMGKGNMALFFGLIGLLLGLQITTDSWIDILLWVVAGLLVLTILNRVWGMITSGQIAAE